MNPVAGNQGFLRADALLAVIVLTDQDDCSVPDDSALMDPTQDAMSDPLGPFSTFRCNEFGHLCQTAAGLQPPPRAGAGPLGGCVSNDTATGRLTKVADEVAFLRGLKSDPSLISVQTIAGPAAPYGIAMQPRTNRLGVTENQPQMIPSCSVAGAALSALPGVRLQQWTMAFANRGAQMPACAASFVPAIEVVPDELSHLANQCITQRPRDLTPTTPALDPDCVVVEHSSMDAVSASAAGRRILSCAASKGMLPCWAISDTVNTFNCPPVNLSFFVTRASEPPADVVTTVSCATCPPGVTVAGCP